MRSLMGLIIVGLALNLMSVVARGEEKPALPPGHPQLPAADATPPLPAGHPKVPGADATPPLPAGHPTVPGATQPANSSLPAGHPTVTPGAGQPGAKGLIVLKVVQGTKGAAAVGADALTVEYYSKEGEVLAKSEGRLSDKGEVTIKDVPLDVPVQPLVAVTHGGIVYRTPGSVMDAKAPEQAIELTVYEATDEQPAWEIRMRHVIVEPAPDGLGVTEMLSVFNPGDRTWTGTVDANKKRATLAITLPAGAREVNAGTAPNDVGVFEEGRVTYASPMVPGATDFQIHYVLPAKNDAAEVTLIAPAATASLFVFLPDDGTTVTTAELKKVEAKPGAKLRANSRFYTAAPQKAGAKVSFTVSGLAAAKPAAAAPPMGTDEDGVATTNEPAAPPKQEGSSDVPAVAKVVAGAGAAVIVATGVAFVFFKSPKNVAGVDR
jgi:hypothetical protein